VSFLNKLTPSALDLPQGNAGPAADAPRWSAAAGVAARARREIFPTCANPNCAAGWIRLWRSRKEPIFEGGWSCSPTCTARLIETAIRREVDVQGIAAAGHRHRIPLGLTMLEQGWISQNDLRRALAAQHAARAGRLGSWLVQGQCATEEQVARALGLQWSCPVLGVEMHHPEAMAALLPRLFVDAYGALPLRVAAGRIAYLGFEDRPDASLALAVERITGLHVETGVVAESAFRPAHQRLLGTRFPQAELIEAGTEAAMVSALTAAVERIQPRDSRLVRVHDCLWLRMWVSHRVPADRNSVADVICATVAH
jgi:hypothetical protein